MLFGGAALMPTPIDNATFAPTDATPTHTLHAEHHQELARSSAAIFPVANYDTPQAAVNAAGAANGGIVRFPLGTTTLTSTLLVPSFVTLEGPATPYRAVEYGINPATLGAMITGPAVTTFDLIQNSDTTNGNAGITIRNLWIGLGVSTTADVSPIVFNKVRRSAVRDCYIRGAVTTSRYGFRHTGISEHNWLMNCNFEGCGIVAGTSTNTLRIIGCEIGAGGISIAGGFNHIIRDCDIYQDGIGPGVAYPAFPSGIKLADVTEAMVVNNSIVASREHGVYLAQGVVSSFIHGNQVVNSSQEVSGTWYGIVLDSVTAAHPSTDNIITGNRCYNRSGTTQKYGIGVGSTSGTQTNNNAVAHNVVSGNATGGIDTFTAGLTNTYRDNRGFVTEAFGNTSVTNGATVTHGLAATPTTVVANARTAKHIVTVTARSSTTFTVGLHDDTGTAIVAGETVDWHAVYTPA